MRQTWSSRMMACRPAVSPCHRCALQRAGNAWVKCVWVRSAGGHGNAKKRQKVSAT